jgi:hypothetical protein
LLGGRFLQHLARGGAHAAQGLEVMAHAARAVGVLVAELRLVALCLGHLHLGPVGLEFVGHHQRPAGAHALPHLGAVAQHRDGAVIGDGDEDLGILAQAMWHAVAGIFRRVFRARGEAGAEDEAAGRDPGQERAAADIGDRCAQRLDEHGIVFHCAPATLVAAALMAARMRG